MEFFDKLPVGNTSRRESPIDWAAVKDELVANEGQWGLVAENVSSSVAEQLRKGRYAKFQGDDLDQFEWRNRRPATPSESYGPRSTDLYGKYQSRSNR